jgi:hypothetical protein
MSKTTTITEVMVECECGRITGERCQGDPLPASEMVTLEWMPESLRASHEASGNYGVWPHNGAERLSIDPSCAKAVMTVIDYGEDGEEVERLDEWVRVIA